MKSGIYRIRNTVNGRTYVGSSQDVERRLQQHRSELNRGTHKNINLRRAWVAMGADAFVFEILERCERSQLLIREEHHLGLALPNVYNAGPAVPGRGNKGRPMAAWQKQYLSEINRGKKASAQTRAKMSAVRLGRKMPPRSPEFIEKQRQSHLGKTMSATQKKMVGDFFRGRKQSTEHIAKRAASWIGRKHSEETKARMRAARIAYLARKAEVSSAA